MLRLINKDIKFPAFYPKVIREDPSVDSDGWDRVGDFTLRKDIDYMPQKGIQEAACHCDSNLIFLCGESQMGKTFLMLLSLLKGVGLPNYTGRFISVRLQDSKKGSSILRDAITILGNFADCEYNVSDYPTFYWPQWNNAIQFIHSNFNINNPQEYNQFTDYAKKNQASRIVIDEATEMRDFGMFTYWFSRNRDNSGELPQMILSFNPEHEHWSTKMLKDAGYIGDDWFIKPEMNGVTRYFYIKGDSPEEIIWGDSPEDVAERADIRITEKERRAGVTIRQIVKSFTMFTGESADNLKLLAATKGQNIGNLHATGATQRAVLKNGYFGPIDKEELRVTRTMIHNLWHNPINDDTNMYATLDVSTGGKDADKCPMVIWKGLQIVAIRFYSGDAKNLVSWIHGILDEYGVPISNFAFDATGIGNYLKDFTAGMGVTANKRPIQELDTYGNPIQLEQYFNLRSQLLGKMRVMFERGDISCALDKYMQIPYGKNNTMRNLVDILFDEINVFVATSRNNKIYYKSKDEYKAKFHHSPDLMDAIVLRAIFELDARPKKQPSTQVADNAYDALFSRERVMGFRRGRW